jgi:sec-independent protein translocase protein TatA
MSIGIWQVAIIGVIIVLLFGRGKISELMGDVAKGIKSFKKGLVEEDSEVDTANTIEHSETPVAEPVEKKTEAS